MCVYIYIFFFRYIYIYNIYKTISKKLKINKTKKKHQIYINKYNDKKYMYICILVHLYIYNQKTIKPNKNNIK